MFLNEIYPIYENITGVDEVNLIFNFISEKTFYCKYVLKAVGLVNSQTSPAIFIIIFIS